MKKIIASILALSLLISGCSYNISREKHEPINKYFERINTIFKNKSELLIRTLEGNSYVANQLQISDDNLNFFNLATGQLEKLKIDRVYSVEFQDKGIGAFEGFIFGALIGGGGTAIFYPTSSGEAKQGRAVAILAGIFIGGLTGIGINAFINKTTTIQISQQGD